MEFSEEMNNWKKVKDGEEEDDKSESYWSKLSNNSDNEDSLLLFDGDMIKLFVGEEEDAAVSEEEWTGIGTWIVFR